MRCSHVCGLPVFVTLGVCLLAAWLQPKPLLAENSFSSERAGFAIRVNGELIPYRTFGVYVLPGKVLSFDVSVDGSTRDYDVVPLAASATLGGTRKSTWKAPQTPGMYPLEIRLRFTKESVRLNVFVMVPYRPSQHQVIEGYRIGRYPSTPLRGLKIYEPPRGLVRATREDLTTLVSPHFTLGQFVCKQKGGFPVFLALRERLLLKLEYLLQLVNEKGYAYQTFHVMSGYRTPYYNQAIGNVRFSRHQWGGAADIFVDESPRDGMMDDLNGDGKIDRQDGEILYQLFEGLGKRPSYEPLIGGLGLYGSTTNHGPFVHVDARGFRARW